MSAQRAKTVRYLGVFLAVQFVLLLSLLAIEIVAVKQGGNSTISEVMWELWAKQPWVVLVVTHSIAGPGWFLAGHFFGQSRDVYDRIRDHADGAPFPHCDPRVLHAPGECTLCDKSTDRQRLRVAWGIAFTGHPAPDNGLPCPADRARGDSHKLWHGNVARPHSLTRKGEDA